MNVIDLLPNHPGAPQRQSFEALLPNLMREAISSLKTLIFRYLDDSSSGNAFQRARESCDVAIARIQYEMKVIRH